MEKIVVLATRAPSSRVKHDDDFVDRLNSRYTVLILVVFTVVISLGQLGKPITCWAPKHFTSAHIKFTNSYCWVKNTYYLPLEDEIPKAHEDDKRDMILYYQWIPFILLLQALFFFIPSQVWHAFNQRGGVDADNILQCAASMEGSKKENSEVLRMMVNQIDRFLGTRMERTADWKVNCNTVCNAIFCKCCGKRMGSYLLVLYLITKLLYIGNVIGQLFILNIVFQTSFNTFGPDFIREVTSGRAWIDNTHFPRVTFCDFPVRRLGNVHRYTVQCVLPLNLYLEIMYLFLWFWMVILAVVTCVSFVTWFIRAICFPDRLKFIKNHLKAGDRIESMSDEKLAREFLDTYLRQDGSFLLRLVAHNTNNITVTEITCGLWDKWLETREKRRNGPSDPEFALKDDMFKTLEDEKDE